MEGGSRPGLRPWTAEGGVRRRKTRPGRLIDNEPFTSSFDRSVPISRQFFPRSDYIRTGLDIDLHKLATYDWSDKKKAKNVELACDGAD